MIESVFEDSLSRANIEEAYQPAGTTLSRCIVVDHQLEPDLAKLLLEGMPAVENSDPSDDIANDEITVEFLKIGLSYECGLIKKRTIVVLFLHMLMTVWYIMWTLGDGRLSACWDTVTQLVALA